MKKLLAVIALTALATTPAEAKKKPEMTSMEIQALQSHDYETTKEILFASVVSVFQDLGYQLANADLPSGFITASSPMKNKTGFWDAMGGSRASGNTKVTAFVEQIGGTARVRLNFVNSKNTSGQWGGSNSEDKPILDPLTYKVAWDKIDEAVFTRTATRAVESPASPVEPAVSPPVTSHLSISLTPPPPTPE